MYLYFIDYTPFFGTHHLNSWVESELEYTLEEFVNKFKYSSYDCDITIIDPDTEMGVTLRSGRHIRFNKQSLPTSRAPDPHPGYEELVTRSKWCEHLDHIWPRRRDREGIYMRFGWEDKVEDTVPIYAKNLSGSNIYGGYAIMDGSTPTKIHIEPIDTHNSRDWYRDREGRLHRCGENVHKNLCWNGA
jgi:hypothetical protein